MGSCNGPCFEGGDEYIPRRKETVQTLGIGELKFSPQTALTLQRGIENKWNLDADGGRELASLADIHIIPLFRRIASADIVLSAGPEDGCGVAAVQETY
jgi:hypothetical protein